MATFLIEKVKYIGEKYSYETPELGIGLNIIEGENGYGKSTFFNLIYYCLSGTVDEFKPDSKEPHNEIVNDKNNYVELEIEINSEKYIIRRFLNSNDIWVTEVEGRTNVFPINRGQDSKFTFSDWILDKLEIAVVDVVQGIKTHKINIKDLLRLIYHDQQPNPKKIYKPAENDGNFVSDSLLVRKIIFQLLLGETYSKYYKYLAMLKIAENEKNKAKLVYDEYLNISTRLRENDDDLNANFIEEEIINQEKKLNRLLITRNNLQITRPPSANKNIDDIEITKLSLLNIETALSELSNQENLFFNEILKYKRLNESQILEVTQLQKIMHSHEKLNLFTPDTCPYCLSKVEREVGKCVCGNTIDETQYERFFYNSSEYATILKSKQKSVQTIQFAIETYEKDLATTEKKKHKLQEQEKNLREQILELVKSIETSYQNNQLDKVDDEILSTKERLSKLSQRFQIELKLIDLQKYFDSNEEKYKQILLIVKKLELAAEEDINNKLLKFNESYNSLMIKTLQNCRSAKIDSDNYMPIINNGEYREISSSVPIRLNYYLTFLQLSLAETGISFPRLLLIDTPRTAGIDVENFNKVLSNISELLRNHPGENYQIIFSSGINQYPDEFKDYVFETLTGKNRLLKPKA